MMGLEGSLTDVEIPEKKTGQAITRVYKNIRIFKLSKIKDFDEWPLEVRSFYNCFIGANRNAPYSKWTNSNICLHYHDNGYIYLSIFDINHSCSAVLRILCLETG